MNKITFDSDRAMTVFGVPGSLTHRTRKPGQAPGLWYMQRWVSEHRPIAGTPAGVAEPVPLGDRVDRFLLVA